MKAYTHRAFSGYGVEIEYAIVDAGTLDIAPVADRLLDAVGGAEDMDVVRGNAAWSNELALHVIEVKTNGPAPDLLEARTALRREVDALHELLHAWNARLLPGGMHPWMDPEKETRLWPHQNNQIYSTFDRIFDCKGHGWSNLQSTHINFPFSSPEEFAALHAACRFVLPLLPALAASSPFYASARAPHLDQRLAQYRTNCARIPSITGAIVPEPVYTEEEYRALLESIYRDLAPHDPAGILAEEWVNARGCIARFDRGAIEIRVLDSQECPEQDFAVVFLVTELVKALSHGEFAPVDSLMAWDQRKLARQLDLAIESADEAAVADPGYAAVLGASQAQTLGAVWRQVVRHLVPEQSVFAPALRLIVEEGSLARRLRRAHGEVKPTRQTLRPIYERLCDCLRCAAPFQG